MIAAAAMSFSSASVITNTDAKKHADAPKQLHLKEEIMTKDPVCGMQVNESQAKAKADYKGQTYYFCSDSCKQKFEANPEHHTKKTT